MNPFTTEEILAEQASTVVERSRGVVPAAEEEPIQTTQGAPFRVEKHHLLPQQAALQSQMEALGINIHRYTVTLDRDRHQREIHLFGYGGIWNEEWETYFAEKERRGETVTKRGVYQKLINMMRRFGLQGHRIHPYRTDDVESDLSDILR
jgi:hypothetical protein